MSFIKDSGEGDKMAKSDIILLVAVVFGGLGIWWYTSHSKSTSYAAFDAAAQLTEEKKYEEAFDAWFELQNASYKSDSLDSLLYENLSFLEELKDGNQKGYRIIKKLIKEDVVNKVKIQQRLKLIREPHFLKDEELALLSEWRQQYEKLPENIVSDSLNTADSSKVKADLDKK